MHAPSVICLAGHRQGTGGDRQDAAPGFNHCCCRGLYGDVSARERPNPGPSRLLKYADLGFALLIFISSSLCCEQDCDPHCGQPRGQLVSVYTWAGHCLLSDRESSRTSHLLGVPALPAQLMVSHRAGVQGRGESSVWCVF